MNRSHTGRQYLALVWKGHEHISIPLLSETMKKEGDFFGFNLV
jgi:hypothetical protein